MYRSSYTAWKREGRRATRNEVSTAKVWKSKERWSESKVSVGTNIFINNRDSSLVAILSILKKEGSNMRKFVLSKKITHLFIYLWINVDLIKFWHAPSYMIDLSYVKRRNWGEGWNTDSLTVKPLCKSKKTDRFSCLNSAVMCFYIKIYKFHSFSFFVQQWIFNVHSTHSCHVWKTVNF